MSVPRSLGDKWHRLRTKSCRGEHDSRARIRYVNRDDPNYVRPKNTNPYTEKQKDILAGIIPLELVGVNELTVLLRKAIDLEDAEVEATVRKLKEIKLHPEKILPKPTKAEAISMLKELDARKEKMRNKSD